jgi:hypothetical protein
MTASRRSIGVALVAALYAIVSMAGPVGAKESIDPATLTPPPPDFFNAVCERTGSQILCTLGFSDPSFVNEPSGVICGTTELLLSQDRSVVGKRFYSADGLLLRRHFHEDFTGSFTNPVTGKVATFVAHNALSHTLATPGDVTTGVTKITGQQVRMVGPAGGVILTDAGRLVIDESNGEIVASSGPKHFDDYFVNGNTAALAPLCAALS